MSARRRTEGTETSAPHPVRVLIVDDHPAIRMAVASTLKGRSDIVLVGEADSASEAFRIMDAEEPDVAIVDLSLSDVHGLDLIHRLHSQYPNTSVIVFSMYDEQSFAERALRAGASSYVMKTEETRTLLDAIDAVRRGDIYLSRRVASHILGRLISNHVTRRDLSVDALTDREMEVFQLLGEGLSMKEITERLNVSYKTVETYRRRARKKLGFQTVGELLQYAIRWKYG